MFLYMPNYNMLGKVKKLHSSVLKLQIKKTWGGGVEFQPLPMNIGVKMVIHTLAQGMYIIF